MHFHNNNHHKLPIVFVHKGYEAYLQLNILHCQSMGAQVFVISDFPYQHCHWIPIHTYVSTSFRKIYVHLSAHAKIFELFCFERWLILNQFLHDKNIDSFLYLDSDCVIYDLSCPTDRLTLSGDAPSTSNDISKSGHALFGNRESLAQFCDFLLDTYRDKQAIDRLRFLRKIRCPNKKMGGISDMALLAQYAWYYPDRVYLGTSRPVGEIYIEDNMNSTSGNFVMENGLKKIQFENKQPYGFLKSGQKVRFANLHFQGGAKKHLARYLHVDTTAMTPLSRYEVFKTMLMIWMGRFKI